MGYGFCIQCTTCGAGDNFSLGIGMMYHSLPNVISCVQGGARKKVENILQNHHVSDVEFEHVTVQLARFLFAAKEKARSILPVCECF